MAITAALVKELRERTQAGMMECKKALTETNGDIEAAIEYMRKAGLAKADKKAGRTAAEGAIIIRTSDDGKSAAMVRSFLVLRRDTTQSSDGLPYSHPDLHLAIETPLYRIGSNTLNHRYQGRTGKLRHLLPERRFFHSVYIFFQTPWLVTVIASAFVKSARK